jgi:iron(III) transport system permease protein
VTNALVEAPAPASPPVPAPRRRARTYVLDAPIVRLLALLVGVSAAIPLSYLIVRVWEMGWGDAWAIATSARTRTVLIDTIVLAVSVTAAALAISVPLAWLTTRTDLPARRTWVVLTALPLAIPTYVGSFAMIGALGPRGIVQGWLEPLGVDRLPSIYGFGGAFVVLTLFTYPYLLLTVRAAYNRLDPSLEEASRTLGRNSLVTFLRVVVPQLKPSIAAGSLLVALYVLSDFGAVSMLRYDTFTRAIYLQYRGGLDRGSAAVMGLMLVLLTIAVLAGEQRLRGSGSLHRLHGSGARVAATVHLGRWRWVAAGVCTTLVTVALVIPLAVIGYWLWRGTRVGESWFPAWSLVTNSLWASALGALLTVACAWPVAMLAVRSPGRSSRLVERLSWSGYALPGIVVALALVFFGAKYVPWAYQTMAMLVFAYMVLFLPQAIGAIRSSLLQVTPSVEEASHLLGSGSFATFRRVVLPLTRPGVTAGAALVFLTCMKELPATLLLSPTGYGTLATRVWTASNEAFLARAAAPALALVVLSSLPMLVLVRREDRSPDAIVGTVADQPSGNAGADTAAEFTRTR